MVILNAECRMQNEEARKMPAFFVLNSSFCVLHSFGGAKGGTRTPTALGHGILSPARLPIPPLSQKVNFGAPTRTRTWNQQIKSLLLYQLSYGGLGSLLTPSDTETISAVGPRILLRRQPFVQHAL